MYSANVNYQRTMRPETPLPSYMYRSSTVPRQSSLQQQSDLLYGNGLQHAGTTYFTPGQIPLPYYQPAASSSSSSSSSIDRLTPFSGRHESSSVSLMNSTANNFNDSGISCTLPENDTTVGSNWSFNSSTASSAQMFTANGSVTLQLSNLDTTYEQASLKKYLISKLQSIAPVLSFTFEGVVAKIALPSMEDAKQVVSYLHRKKVGHKRICVSYTKDCSSLDPSTLKCQVAGLLKDIPNYRLSMYKFRELFQSRFKTSISVGNLCAMSDICTIVDNATEKFVCLRPELSQLIERGELNDCLLQSVPYCSIHFKKGHRGWAEQEIEPLPNVWMSVADVRNIIFALTKKHTQNIPVASLIHCIQSELDCNIVANEKGVNFEHLLSCVNEIQITTNKFGIKVLNWLLDGGGDGNRKLSTDDSFNAKGQYAKNTNLSDAYGQFSNDVYELLQTCPKSTMKFARFIPTYHNTFNRQCRVADYGFVKLIDLFDAIPLTVQVLGEGENRLITLTHKRQMRRLAADLHKLLRTSSNKSIRLSLVPKMLSTNQKLFEITDYGICNLKDAVEELSKNVTLISLDPLTNSDDMLLSLPKKRASNSELRKTSVFAAETIELLKNAPQYTIAYEKFSCSYHYHFTYQLRLNDYGHNKLADMMECLMGIVKVCMPKIELVPALCMYSSHSILSFRLKSSTTKIVRFTCAPRWLNAFSPNSCEP